MVPVQQDVPKDARGRAVSGPTPSPWPGDAQYMGVGAELGAVTTDLGPLGVRRARCGEDQRGGSEQRVANHDRRSDEVRR